MQLITEMLHMMMLILTMTVMLMMLNIFFVLFTTAVQSLGAFFSGKQGIKSRCQNLWEENMRDDSTQNKANIMQIYIYKCMSHFQDDNSQNLVIL